MQSLRERVEGDSKMAAAGECRLGKLVAGLAMLKKSTAYALKLAKPRASHATSHIGPGARTAQWPGAIVLLVERFAHPFTPTKLGMARGTGRMGS
jgi:hypothetical protein